MSAWMTAAPGAKLSSLPVTRSSNLAPSATRRSAFCREPTAATVPCMPGMPTFWGWLLGKPPRAISVVTTGIPVSSASASSSALAPALITPPPTYRTGRWAVVIILAASRTCRECGRVTGW